MEFEHELTYFRLLAREEASTFHARYEEGLAVVKDELGMDHHMIIDGKRVTSVRLFQDVSPIDTSILVARFPLADVEHIAQAIGAARRAFRDWRRMDYRDRVNILRRAADIMSSSKYELAALITYENGKNRYEAMADVDEAIDFMRYYAYEMERNDGYTRAMKSAYPDERCYSVMKPYGVFGVIAPFNFPLALTAGMCSGALVTGNTVVLKPASDTPLTALRFCEVLEEAGLPDGVLNMVTGSGSTVGDALVASRDVDGIVFTGSKEVGLSIFAKATSSRPRPVITEMGGKNPTIVTPSASIGKAAEGVARAAFGYSGQKCSACSRVYVHSSVYDEFVSRLVGFTSTLRVGNPIERDVFMGPLINKAAYDKYEHYVRIAGRDGRILAGGRQLTDGMLKHGYYVEPVIVDNLGSRHTILTEELFLPFLAVIRYDTLDDAIAMCNESEYGLTAGLYSNDEDEIRQFLDRMEAGVLYVNRARSATTGAMVGSQPFVGWKMSGISGKGTGSIHYLPLFMREQSQTICS
ncbi:MAG: aldehyde dehydrogenase family protein [Candidatus Nitrosocaldus sp.]|nr:aldehyde dehydrogenase family protein [Candidatus Nitrosocaldus sp.]MDW8000164.1 aldehyde dehydrogenase family protein [Candidatus Nitrosocaldus sp.]